MLTASGMLTLVVLARLVAGTWTYVLQKELTDDPQQPENPGALITGGYLGMSVLMFAAAPFLDWRPAADWRFWQTMAWVPVVEALGSYMSIYALRGIDMSIFGPINALKAPLSMPVSILVKGEYPRPLGVLGAGIIVAGCYLLRPPRVSGQTGKDVWHLLSRSDARWRIGSMVLFAVSGVFLRVGVVAGGTLLSVCVWVWGGFLTCLCLSRGVPGWSVAEAAGVWRRRPVRCAGVTTLLLVLQITTHYTFGVVLVGYALAFFQFGMFFQVLAGRYRFNERQVGARLWAALVMFAGVVVIAKWG